MANRGVLWVVVSAIGEYVAEETTTSTMANFPTIVVLSILTVTGSFLVAYGVTAAVVAIRGRSDGFRWGQAINLMVGIAGLVVGSLQFADDNGKRDRVDRDQDTGVGLLVETTGEPPSSESACTSGEIMANVETRCVLKETDDKLPDGTHYQPFRYRGADGENVTISMCAEFDTYLILGIGDVTTGDFEWLAENDDGGIGMGTNAQLGYRFDKDAVYTVVANSFAPAETGEFALTIEREGSTNGQFECPPSG